MSKRPDVSTNQQLYDALSALMTGEALPKPRVIPSSLMRSAPLWEPDDSKQPIAVSGIAAAAVGGGGQEIKFAAEGLFIPGSGAIGVYWARANRQRWTPITPGRAIAIAPDSGFFVGTIATGIAPAGVLSGEFYLKPKHMSWPEFQEHVYFWTRAIGSENALGALLAVPGGTTASSDTTIGTFSQLFSDPALQIQGGTVLLLAGATQKCEVILRTPYGNTDSIYVGETAALAVANNNELGALGTDTWVIPAGGKLFFKSASGTQGVSAKVRV